jgi:hypothetical protein
MKFGRREKMKQNLPNFFVGWLASKRAKRKKWMDSFESKNLSLALLCHTYRYQVPVALTVIKLPGDGQYRGKENHRRCNCMRPAKHIRVKTKYSVCVVVEVYARKDESPPPHVKTTTGFNMG